MLTFSFDPFPVIETERLLLRRVVREDAKDLFLLRSDKEVMKYIGRPLAVSTDDILVLIDKFDTSLKQGEGISWAITLKEENLLKGTIGFWRIIRDHHRAEIGYMLHPGLHGKGIMQEALTAVLDYGFQVMKLHTVEAIVEPGNESSVRMLEKNNFIKEGHFKENFFFEGIFRDSLVFSLLTPVR